MGRDWVYERGEPAREKNEERIQNWNVFFVSGWGWGE